jgi:2-polyprenyl-3-methyl-5-hydroxy-6-metoxy-1,4-benzoquinol methylase
MAYLAPAEGGVLVDASCGTGLFTRLFARSQKFKGVVALDFRCEGVDGGSQNLQEGLAYCQRHQGVF